MPVLTLRCLTSDAADLQDHLGFKRTMTSYRAKSLETGSCPALRRVRLKGHSFSTGSAVSSKLSSSQNWLRRRRLKCSPNTCGATLKGGKRVEMVIINDSIRLRLR